MNSTMAARFTSAKQPDDHRIVYEEVPAQESSDSSDQTQAASMKMFGKLTRDSFEWHPENTLCKRFNIPNPYPGSRVVGVPKVRRPKFSLGDLITPQQPLALTYEQSATISNDDSKSEMLGTTSKSTDGPIPSDSKSASSELATKAFVAPSVATSAVDRGIGSSDTQRSESQEDKTEETQNERIDSAPVRPSMDLFKAIFADSSSDESEASDEDEDGKEKAETEPVSIQASENKPLEKSSSSHVDLRTEDNKLASRFTSDNKTLSQDSPSKPTRGEEQKQTDMQAVATKNANSKEVESSSEVFGPAPPSSGHKPSSPHHFSREKHSVDTTQNKEDSDRSKRKQKRKDKKKRYSDSTDSEDEYRSRHKHKEKKKHKHKHKSKHRDDEEERIDKKAKGNDFPSQTLGHTRVPDDKQILSKLKNLQNLKAGKRMRAADFMSSKV